MTFNPAFKLGFTSEIKVALTAVGAIAVLFLTACEEEQPVQKPTTGIRTELALKVSDFRYVVERERNTYYHSRNYVESGGMGATLTRGKVCVENGKICVESGVRYRVEPGKTLTQPNHKVATTLKEDRITIEYWGTADNGEPIHIRRIIKTSGRTATLE
ncbi:MAG: hypothetical protein O2912_06200 [Proteobacteria bacterium]|nr:hypothetical protein [Pseudomonadota bacterium]